MYGAYKDDGTELHICPKGDHSERMDTIRHEAWHFIQDMSDCNLADKGVKPVYPGVSKAHIDRIEKEGLYGQSEVLVEAEAFWAAETMTADKMADLVVDLRDYCRAKATSESPYS